MKLSCGSWSLPAALGCLGSCSFLLACGMSGPSSEPPSEVTSTESQEEPRLVVDPPAYEGEGLKLVPAEGWEPVEPSTAFRIAQYRLPRVDGDAEDAELIAFRMSAGSFSQNVARWTGQFEQPDGRPSSEVATQSSRRVHGMPVYEFECAGRFVAETTPGSGERLDKPGFRMLASVVESPHGPYYFKLVGPDATVRHWRASYTDFLSRLEP